MKISINFLPSQPPWFAILFAAGSVTALAGVLLAVWLTVNLVQRHAEVPALTQRIASLNQQTQAIPAQSGLPDEKTLSDLRRRVVLLNRYSVASGWSAPTLLAWLERQLPNDVYLVSLHQNLELGHVKLVAESANPSALTRLLARLEKEPHFREVLLVRQGPRAGRLDRMQFVIELRERR